jgi:hypothetical protein
MSSLERKSQAKLGRMTKAELLNELNNAIGLAEGRGKELSLLLKKLNDAKTKEKKLTDQLQNNKKKIVDLEKINARLEEKIIDVQHTEEMIPEDFSVGRAAFRIELYPRQGHYQGKIEHLLTRDKKGFSGLDNEVIMGFISEHLPPKEEQVEEPQPDALPAKEADQVETNGQTTEALHIREFNIIPTGAWRPTGVVPTNSPFHVQLILDPSDIATEQAGRLNYNVSIYAKRLEGGHRKIIGEVKGEVKSTDPFKTKVAATALPTGIYRFEAIGKFKEEEKAKPVDVFGKSSLISIL